MAAKDKRPTSRAVTLTLAPEEFAFAEREGGSFGYFGPEDFLNSLLSTAVAVAMADRDDPYSREVRHLRKLTALQDVRISVLKELLHEVLGGCRESKAPIEADEQLPGMHLCDPDGALDDDLPF